MVYCVCIALNGTITEVQIPTKTKDVLDWIRKKYKSPGIQFQGKLQDPSKDTRMLSVFALVSSDDDDVSNSHILPSPFDEEIYNSPIVVLSTENDNEDSYIPLVSGYVNIRSHEYETLYQEWAFAVDEEDGVADNLDLDDEVEDEQAPVIYEDIVEEESAVVVQKIQPTIRTQITVNTRDVFVDCAIREKVIENFTKLFESNDTAIDFEHHMLRHIVASATKENYDIDWTNRTFWNMYRNRAISLYENIRGLNSYVKNDHNLLDKMKSGELSVRAIAEMTPIDLCPSRWKSTIEKLIETEKKLYSSEQTASMIAWCSSCKKKTDCSYYQLQTRSADEPMTTFVTCLGCTKKWKF